MGKVSNSHHRPNVKLQFGDELYRCWNIWRVQSIRVKIDLSPGFGTSISPWVVTLDALQPFRCKPKTVQDPAPVKHLNWPGVDDGTFDIKLKVELIRECTRMDISVI